MEEIGKAFNALFSKIGDFFDVFDLSFIVSGAALIGSIYIWLEASDFSLPSTIKKDINVFTLVVMCYIAGLVCFALGRFIRYRIIYIFLKKEKRNKYNKFVEALKAHQLTDYEKYRPYLDEENLQSSRLYIRLWAEIRQNEELAPSFSLLRRYWVMAATYDGLASVALFWIYTAVDASLGLSISQLEPLQGGLSIFIAVLVFYVCSREAKRYVSNQIEEIVATLAATNG